MINPTTPRFAQSPDDATMGAGGAGATEAKTADAAADATQTGEAASAAVTKQNGGKSTRSSELGTGAVQGDASKDGKATNEAAGRDAGGANTPAPVKVQLPDKLPDGVTVDQDFVSGFETQAAKAGLDSSKASALVAWYLDQQAAQGAKVAQDLDRWSAENQKTLEKDPEYGGVKLAESRANVQRVLSRFDPKSELKTLLTEFHLDNHPVICRALAAIGRSFAEDKISVEEVAAKNVPSDRQKMAALFPSHEKLRKEMGE